jgi:hypothetical protein
VENRTRARSTCKDQQDQQDQQDNQNEQQAEEVEEEWQTSTVATQRTSTFLVPPKPV